MLVHPITADTRRGVNVGLMVVHHLRRWTTIEPTLIQRLVSAGMFVIDCS